MSAFPPYPADGIAEIGGRGFDFGSLRFDDGERLSPKAAHVLWLLVQAAGRTLEKDTLLDHAWAGQPRVPDVLVQAVGEIRRGLGDSDRRGLVLTVPKIGYRLQAEVRWRVPPGATMTPPSAAVADATVPAAAPPTRLRRLAPLVLGLLFVAALLAFVVLRLGPSPAPPAAVEPPVQAGWTLAGMERLTHEPGPDLMPQLDPAGSTLLYVRRIDGRYGLWRRRLDGSPPQPVAPAADSDDLYPAWDGEGRRIAFLRYAAGGCRVMLLDDIDATPREVGGCFADFAAPLSFGADGASLLLTDRIASAQPTLHLVRLDLTDGRLSLLDYARDPQRTDSDARLAPDGQRIAFRRGGAGVVELHVHDVDRGSSRRLAALAGGMAGFDWLPDGSGLLLSALDANHPTLSLLSPDGTITPLAEGRYGRLQRARDSDRWAAVSGSTRSGLWRQQADGAEEAPLLEVGVGQDRHPLALERGGLLFVSDRSGQPELWEIAAGAAAPQQLSRRSGGSLAAPLRRSDDEVWVPSLQQGRWQLWRWRRGEAAGSLLAAPGYDLLELADDGQRLWAIAARDDQAGSSELVELQVKDDTLSLRRTGVEAIALRAGDGRLYVRQHLRRGIRAVDPQTLALSAPVGDRHFIDWQLDGDAALHWVADDALRHSLWRTPLGGGEPQRLFAGRDDIAVGAGFTRLADGSLVTVRIDLDDLDIVGFRLTREDAAAAPPP